MKTFGRVMWVGCAALLLYFGYAAVQCDKRGGVLVRGLYSMQCVRAQ